MFRDDRLVGLIDFDDANYTYLAFDLVCLIESWAWQFPSEMLDFPPARAIVQAHENHRPLSNLERRHFFDVHKLSILFDCIWNFGRGLANEFYERKKIEFLNGLGWEEYAGALFS